MRPRIVLFMFFLLGEGVEISTIGHPLKMPNPKVAFVDRIETFFNDDQLLNTELPITVTEEGIEISFNEEQSAKEFEGMSLQSRKLIFFKEEQPLKQPGSRSAFLDKHLCTD